MNRPDRPPAPPLEGVGGWLSILIAYLVFLLPLGVVAGLAWQLRLWFIGQSMHEGFLLHTAIPRVTSLFVVGMGLYAGIALRTSASQMEFLDVTRVSSCAMIVTARALGNRARFLESSLPAN